MHTILVVEDEFGAADVMMAALEDEGYRVVVAANGRQGLERLAETPPDLIIVDYMMPIMDGAAMARTVKENPDSHSIPIVMTSALSEEAVRQQFSGFQVFLRKPFRIDELLMTVGTILRGS